VPELNNRPIHYICFSLPVRWESILSGFGTSGSVEIILSSSVGLLNPENIGLAVDKIAFLSSLQPEIKEIPSYSGRNLGFSTSGFFPFDRTTLPLTLFDIWTPTTLA